MLEANIPLLESEVWVPNKSNDTNNQKDSEEYACSSPRM